MLSRLSPVDHTVHTRAGSRRQDLLFSWHNVVPIHPLTTEAKNALKTELTTPLSLSAFEEALRNHPDRLFVALVLDTIQSGVNLGFTGDRTMSVLPPNHAKKAEDLDKLQADVDDSLTRGWAVGWFSTPPFRGFRTSPLSVIDKTENGKVVGKRRITDASSPHGDSVNDGIQQLYCPDDHIETVLEALHKAGPGAKLAKVDVEKAYRLLAVRKCDWPLLGITLRGLYAVDTHSPFGLRASPPHWQRIAKAVRWILVFLGYNVFTT